MNSERMKGAELIFLLDLLYVQRGEKRGEEQRVGVKPAKLFSLCFFYPFGCCSLRLVSSRNLFFFPNSDNPIWESRLTVSRWRDGDRARERPVALFTRTAIVGSQKLKRTLTSCSGALSPVL